VGGGGGLGWGWGGGGVRVWGGGGLGWWGGGFGGGWNNLEVVEPASVSGHKVLGRLCVYHCVLGNYSAKKMRGHSTNPQKKGIGRRIFSVKKGNFRGLMGWCEEGKKKKSLSDNVPIERGGEGE